LKPKQRKTGAEHARLKNGGGLVWGWRWEVVGTTPVAVPCKKAGEGESGVWAVTGPVAELVNSAICEK
jgi:hypothetical protein